MKRTEIEAKWNTLTPRERDAWVAEVVFVRSKSEQCDRIGGCLKLLFGADSTCKCDKQINVPNYTTDISAAWAVVEAFDYIECARLPFRPNCYGARINGTDGDILAITQAPTAPEAICLAAIIAKLMK